jgi:2-dehydro-3-deoxygalactonokinase
MDHHVAREFASPSSADFGLPDDLLTLAVDGGTTNTRARLLRGGLVLSEARRAVGARDVATTGAAAALAAAIRDTIAEACRAAGVERPDRIVASGMLTSEVGLAALPHAPAPAGLDDLARAAVALDRPDVAPMPILLVPGVRTPAGDGADGWAGTDVMRGEECEVIGLCAILLRDGQLSPGRDRRLAFLLPGSHTKLVVVDWSSDGPRILSSHTTLAGELLATLSRHTILAASLPGELPRVLDPVAVESGARLARRDGLGRAAFLVRIAALARDWSAEQRAAFLIGAVAADDLVHLGRIPRLAAGTDALVLVGGAEPLRGTYAGLLGRPAIPATGEHAAALGAALVGKRRADLR